MPRPKKNNYGRVSGANTYLSYDPKAIALVNKRAAERGATMPPEERAELLRDFRNLQSHMGESYRPIGTRTVMPMRMVEEIIMSYPEKELSYRNGGTVKYRSGGMMKYEQGGPVGSTSSDQKFRVIPEKSPTGQTELAYYIDGRPVESQDFMEQFYAVGNKPQDLNQLIENSVIASKQGVGAESLISGGSPLEGLMKQYRDALKERNVYREQGAAGIDSLYNARQQNYEEMLRRMGG